jgi:dTDP-4-amino-4,6-dideoxygalactose transaminase
MKVPYFNLSLKYINNRGKILKLMDEVGKTGNLLDGEYSKQLGLSISKYLDKSYTVLVGSGTDALFFTLASLPCKKVLLPAYSYLATATVMHRLPHMDFIFCDVDSNCLMDLDLADKLIYEHKCDCMVFVNLFGNPVNPNRLLEIKGKYPELMIIEDGAQSIGAKWDSESQHRASDIVTMSFDPTKAISGMGNGGSVSTNKAGLIERIEEWSRPGGGRGFHSRMDELDCAYAYLQLTELLPGYLSKRKEIAKKYNEAFKDLVSIPRCSSLLGEHAYLRYVVHFDTSKQRNEIMKHLNNCFIQTRLAYEYTLPNEMSSLNIFDINTHNNASKLSETNLGLPMYPELEDYQVDFVIEKFLEMSNHATLSQPC